MIRSLYTAASGMTAQQMNLDNIANNLANSQTNGFYKRRLQFSDVLYQNIVAPGSAATQQTTMPTGLQVGLGTRPGASEMVQTQGDFVQTGNQYDLAIQGQGFFQVQLVNGQIAYTRNGNFHLDSQGNIVDSNGNPLQPAITVPPNALNVNVGTDGTVTVTLPGQTNAQQIGQIQIVTFPNSAGLSSAGNNMLLATTASGNPIIGNPGDQNGLGTIQQGVLEQSNVSVVEEFIQMIAAQRSYESNSKVVSAADQMLQQTNQLSR
jgi:flagellar basal-body rod protein FlgG